MDQVTIAGLTVEPVSGSVLCRSERRLHGIVRVRHEAEVAAVVRAARDRGWVVHPISGGKNWGMGTYLPKQHDRLILDLSALKAIGPLDRAAGCVRIEAGVTQLDLYTWLQREAPDLALNVTGAAAATSIVGNAMERGIGYDGSRADEVFGLEVVLPDGSRHCPAERWFSATGLEPVGPNLDALWAQSEWGVVTALWVKLRRRQEREVAVVISGGFDDVMGLLETAYRTGVLTLPAHVAGDERAEIVSAGLLAKVRGREPTREETRRVFPIVRGHTAIAALRGPRRLVRAAVQELRQRKARGVKIDVVTAAKLDQAERVLRAVGWRNKADFVAAIRPLLALTWGVPSDAGMVAVPTPPGGADAGGADAGPTEGVIYFNAVCALELAQTREVERLVRQRFPATSITRIVLRGQTLVHVCTIMFRPELTEATHAALEALCKELRDAGFPPYRLGVANAGPWASRQGAATDLLTRIADTAGARTFTPAAR